MWWTPVHSDDIIQVMWYQYPTQGVVGDVCPWVSQMTSSVNQEGINKLHFTALYSCGDGQFLDDLKSGDGV